MSFSRDNDEAALDAPEAPTLAHLDSAAWEAPLAEFAAATGVAVSFYDLAGRQLSGPHAPTPFAELLRDAGFWEGNGLGAVEDRRAVVRVSHAGQASLARIGDLLEVCAVPARLGDRTVGVFVCGWTPFQFSDPVACDRFARQAGVPPGDLWHRLRLQTPLPDRKLGIFGQMLQTLAAALLRQLDDGLRERQTASCLRILNTASIALTGATTYDAIGDACLAALSRLLPGCAARVLVAGGDGTLTELPASQPREPLPRAEDLTKIIRLTTDQSKLVRVPIQAADGSLLGVVEVETVTRKDQTDVESLMAPLAAQLAVALQKVRLIADLEHERTQLDAALVELKRMSRVRDEFLATVSHELRTPLNAMLGWCQLLRSGGLEEPEREEALHTIERNATAQARLIDDLLDMSRVITGKLVLEARPVNLVDVLNGAITAIRPAAESKSIRLRCEFVRGVLPFLGDALRLQQVFWNLLSNAVKFTPDGGRIMVVAEVSDGRIHVRVSDTGKGIRPEFLDQVFERFSQEDGSYTRRYGGLGLGLAIVRHLVELHGGDVTVQSDGEGMGAAFDVVLPLNAGPHRLGSLDPEPDLLLSGLRVLAVDDDPVSLRILRATLEEAGAGVRLAGSAPEALEILPSWRPDLIVSDIDMPGANGYELIRRVRELPPERGGGTPAFALTGYTASANKVLALEAGYQKHLDKPLNREQLLAALRDFVACH